MEDSDEIEENELEDIDYSSKSEFSKAQIVAEAIREIRKARACEMKEGYYNFKISKTGDILKIWIPDTRKVFVSSVDSCLSLLSPETFRDKRMIEVVEKLEEEKKKLFEKYCYRERIKVEGKNNEWEWKLTGKKWIPKIDEGIPIDDPQYKSTLKFVIMDKGLWNDNINRYWDEMVELYDKVNSEINILIDSESVNYFKKKGGFG